MSWPRRYAIELILVGILALAVFYFAYLALGLLPGSQQDRDFRGSAALNDVGMQMAYGGRAIGTQSNLRMGNWLVQQLTGLGWDVVIQEFKLSDAVQGKNLIAVRSPDGVQTGNRQAPVGMIVAHYDTRIAADRDANSDNQTRPALGANHGASGAATLLELARALDVETAGHTLCLAFTDGDANIGVPGWTTAAGSTHLAQTLARDVSSCANPAWVITLDLVGGVDATFPHHPQSDAALQNAIWAQATSLGHGNHFTAATAEGAPDPFAAAGIPTVLITDPSYPYTATLADAADKISVDTLEAVGRTIEAWIEAGAPR